MKFTSYEQLKNATEEELKTYNIDDYTDEEDYQVWIWMIEVEQECIPPEKLLNMSEEEIWWYHLNNKNILNKVISEAPKEFIINGKKILGREIITYPEFSIIQENGKNNFYKQYYL